MSTVADLFVKTDEFAELLALASMAVTSDWEENFVSDMEEKFEKYGGDMFLTDRQLHTLKRIVDEG